MKGLRKETVKSTQSVKKKKKKLKLKKKCKKKFKKKKNHSLMDVDLVFLIPEWHYNFVYTSLHIL